MGFRRSTPYKVLPGVRLTITDPTTGERRPLALRPASPPGPTRSTGRLPGRTSPGWVRRLHHALLLGDCATVRAEAAAHGHGPLGSALAGLCEHATGARAARSTLRSAWEDGLSLEQHPFVVHHLPHATVAIAVSNGVRAVLPVSRDALGLALVSCERDAGELHAAIAVAEDLDPSVVAVLLLVDLYLRADRLDDVVDLTEGLSNTDDATALLLVQRATALRATDRPVEADAALQDAIRWGVRGSVVRRVALAERDWPVGAARDRGCGMWP